MYRGQWPVALAEGLISLLPESLPATHVKFSYNSYTQYGPESLLTIKQEVDTAGRNMCEDRLL